MSFQVQRYEGASTLYGPHTLAAYIKTFKDLAVSMISRNESAAGPLPPDMRGLADEALGTMIKDVAPSGMEFGDLIKDAMPSYNRVS